MLEFGIELLKTFLFNPTVSPEIRMKAAYRLGSIGTDRCIEILKDYILTGDKHFSVLPEAIDAFGWALEQLHHREEDAR